MHVAGLPRYVSDDRTCAQVFSGIAKSLLHFFTASSLGVRRPYDPRDCAPSVDDPERAQDYRDEEWRRFGFFCADFRFLSASGLVLVQRYRDIDQLIIPARVYYAILTTFSGVVFWLVGDHCSTVKRCKVKK